MTDTCAVTGCDKLRVARGYCHAHYRRDRLYGDPLGGHYTKKVTPSRTCIIDGCGRRRHSDGLCPAHAARKARHGEATGGRASEKLGIERGTCSAVDCRKTSEVGALCWAHFNRRRYLADPQTAARYSAEYRARQRGAAVERFTPEEIYERDEWRCGLCSQRINRSREYPHPRSASIDHVVPLIDGGEHSRRNVQAAHLDCNKRKGARGGNEQLLLIG